MSKVRLAQALVFVAPGPFHYGCIDDVNQGRQANEVIREVNLTRPFYLATHEVSNEQFRRFDPQYHSGSHRDKSLDGDRQPVVNVSWEQAALYCNWLSEQEGLPLAYQVTDGKVTGFEPAATGYRLPTEAEWAWAARTQGKSGAALLKFGWGNTLPPAADTENIADRSAAFSVGRVLRNYDDRYPVSAPVGSFAANALGLFDMGGNVAEWVNDIYGTRFTRSGEFETNPLGPATGKFRVIRGASWAHGGITQLRLSHRDFNDKGRNDVGFRIARYVE